jgi:hypothetical protein
MATPSTRTPVRIARGTYANLNASILDLAEGEICYATDQNKVYVVEGGVLTEQPYLATTGGTVTGNLEIGTAGSLTFEGATADAFETTVAVVDPTADRTITLPDATTTLAGLGVVQSFTVAQRGTVSALGAVAAGTTTLDLATANNFSLSLPAGGTVTLANPSNQTAGQSGVVTITQNGTTAALVAYGGNWKFQSGAPSVSTTLSSVNVIAYYVESSSRITAQLLTNTIS